MKGYAESRSRLSNWIWIALFISGSGCERSNDASSLLSAGVSFGGHSSGGSTSEPPAGPTLLNILVKLDDKPVVGATVRVALDSAYETKAKATDASGRLQLHLSPKLEYINSVSIDEWRDRPRDRKLFLVSAHETSPAKGEPYSIFAENFDGLSLESLGTDAKTLSLELRDTVSMLWPPDNGPNAAPETNLQQAVKWQPVKGATNYEVQIEEVLRHNDGVAYEATTFTRVQEPLLTLSDLPHEPSTEKSREYGIRVIAFDSENRLITASERFYGEHLFKLNDGNRFVSTLTSHYSKEDLEKISAQMDANDKRLQAVEQLIDTDQIAAAESAIDQMTGSISRGRMTAIKGYLLAKQRECLKAIELFGQARYHGGPDTVAPKYREPCRKK